MASYHLKLEGFTDWLPNDYLELVLYFAFLDVFFFLKDDQPYVLVLILLAT